MAGVEAEGLCEERLRGCGRVCWKVSKVETSQDLDNHILFYFLRFILFFNDVCQQEEGE